MRSTAKEVSFELFFIHAVVRMQSRELIANNEVRPNIKEFTETSTILDKE